MDKSHLNLLIAQCREQYIVGAPLHETELAILDLADQIDNLRAQITFKEPPTNAKPIQIAYDDGEIFAVGDDGTIWRLTLGQWCLVPPIPQD